ncbi:MAG: acylphosphatase [Candidatus Krumholzibacteria bacterium]|nr:acylphosphatase [Candidatus Krumholzibacteria bacterium]
MPGTGESRTVRIRVAGLVQGVGFRFFVLREAGRIGVKGYVRNLPDGSVEAVASGGNVAVEEFISRLRIGPSSARVSGVAVEEIRGSRDYDGFEVVF